MKRDPLAASEKKPKKLYPLDHSSRLCSSRKILPRSVKPWGVLIISFFLLPTLWNFFHFFFKFPRVKGTNKCVLGSLCCQTDFFFQVAKGHFYNMLKTNLDNDCTSSSFVFWLFFARVKTLSNSESWRFSLGTNILFENYSKCRIFSILAFFTNFCPIKIDLSGNTVWQQASGFQNSPNSTAQNVNVARFARNVECDFFRRISNTVVL